MERTVLLRVSLVGAFLFLTSAVAGLASADESGRAATIVELRVWQHVREAENIWISARPSGGDWGELGTFQFEFNLDGLDAGYVTDHWDHSYRFGEFKVRGVPVIISQHRHEPELVYASTCRLAQECGLILVQLDDGHSLRRLYRYGDLTLAVPPKPDPPPENDSLLADRATLLALRDVLPGRERTLNWHPSVPMTRWTGVTIGGRPATRNEAASVEQRLAGGHERAAR